MSRDFRVEKTLLAGTAYAVFGCGNSEYPPKDFNAVARRLDRALRLLGGRRLLARREGDDVDNALSEQFDAWLQVRGRGRPGCRLGVRVRVRVRVRVSVRIRDRGRVKLTLTLTMGSRSS